MDKATLKKSAMKAITLAQILASLTANTKDDAAVSLIGSLFLEEDKFAQICEILGIAQ